MLAQQKLLENTFPKCPIFLEHFFVSVITTLQIFNSAQFRVLRAAKLDQVAKYMPKSVVTEGKDPFCKKEITGANVYKLWKILDKNVSIFF